MSIKNAVHAAAIGAAAVFAATYPIGGAPLLAAHVGQCFQSSFSTCIFYVGHNTVDLSTEIFAERRPNVTGTIAGLAVTEEEKEEIVEDIVDDLFETREVWKGYCSHINLRDGANTAPASGECYATILEDGKVDDLTMVSNGTPVSVSAYSAVSHNGDGAKCLSNDTDRICLFDTTELWATL